MLQETDGRYIEEWWAGRYVEMWVWHIWDDYLWVELVIIAQLVNRKLIFLHIWPPLTLCGCLLWCVSACYLVSGVCLLPGVSSVSACYLV